jgi:hypothetical protein
VVARRKGDAWYLGGINGLEKPLEVTFELPFKSGKSALHIITDGNAPGIFSEQFIMPNGKPVSVKLLPYGGFVGQIKL